MKMEFCVLCGSKESIEHHHIVPKSIGGTDDEENLLTLCSKHHVKIHLLSDTRIHSANLIREAKRRNKNSGLFLGGRIPFGYCLVNNKLVRNEKEQKIIKDIISKHQAGMTLRELVKYLKDIYSIDRSHTSIAEMVKMIPVGK